MHVKLAPVIAALAIATSAFAENYFVATVFDFLGEKTFVTVNREQAKELEAKIKTFNAMLPKIVSELQKEFQKNPSEHVGEKFLGNKLKPMKVTFSPAFTDEAKAQERAEKLQENEDEKDVAQGKKPKKLSAAQKERAFKEAEKQIALEAFAKEINKMIEERLAEKAEKSE